MRHFHSDSIPRLDLMGVLERIDDLLEQGVYEAALLWAYCRTPVNYHNWHDSAVKVLFRCADRKRLRAAGDPIPTGKMITLYRGVAGRGRARRVRGISWTASLKSARWFSERGAIFGLADPAVYTITVRSEDILARITDHKEDEYLLLLGPTDMPRRLAAKGGAC